MNREAWERRWKARCKWETGDKKVSNKDTSEWDQ